MEKLDKDFKNLWRKSNLNSENVLELTLVIILWRYLSDIISSGRPEHQNWNDPGTQYHFDLFNNKAQFESTVSFKTILKKWREVNDSLNFIFDIEEKNLNLKTITDAWLLVRNITSPPPPSERWTIEYTKSVFDKVSSSFIDDWQFAHEYFTPRDVSMLMVGLVKREDEVTIYDPSCGSGDLLHDAVIGLSKTSQISGVTNNSFMRKFANIRLLMLNIPYNLFYHNNEISHSEKFDVIITNPPFGIREVINNDILEIGKWSKLPTSKRSEARHLVKILDLLSEKGNAVLILPNGIFSEKANTALRREMVEENLVEAIIHLPKNIFYQTRVSASLLLLNKQKKNANVLFIDATNLGIKERDRVRLSEDNVQSILNLYYSDGDIDFNFSKKLLIGLDLLRENDYDLLYTTYDRPEKPPLPRPSKEILNECLTLENELIEIRRKIKEIII